MNSQYDVYMCRAIDKLKETERQLADAELIRSFLDDKSFKIRVSGRYAGLDVGGVVVKPWLSATDKK